MSDELRSLEAKKQKLERQLADVKNRILQEQLRLGKIKNEIKCPKCGFNNWKVYATFDPFHKIAFESRQIKFECLHCGFTFVEWGRQEVRE